MEGFIAELLKIKDKVTGKGVFLVIDGAPEHGKKDELPAFLASLRGFTELSHWLNASNGSIQKLSSSANSPQLSLCEYYNRTLRTAANRL